MIFFKSETNVRSTLFYAKINISTSKAWASTSPPLRRHSGNKINELCELIMHLRGPKEDLRCLSGMTRGRRRRQNTQRVRTKVCRGTGGMQSLKMLGEQMGHIFFLTPVHPPCLKLDSFYCYLKSNQKADEVWWTKRNQKKQQQQNIQWMKLRFSLPSDNSVTAASPVGLSVGSTILPRVCVRQARLIQSLGRLLSTYYMAGIFLGTGASSGESTDTDENQL